MALNRRSIYIIHLFSFNCVYIKCVLNITWYITSIRISSILVLLYLYIIIYSFFSSGFCFNYFMYSSRFRNYFISSRKKDDAICWLFAWSKFNYIELHNWLLLGENTCTLTKTEQLRCVWNGWICWISANSIKRSFSNY